MLRESLDQIGRREGTDKASGRHDYLAIYARHLESLRDTPVKVLELGVFNGASLRMWRDYFASATIIGADIKAEALQHAGDRMIVEVGDCGSPTFLEQLARTHGPFDVVVDDASHRWRHQQVAFETLFPLLNRGGRYILEDIHTSYYPRYGTDWPLTTVDWLKAAIDDVVSDKPRTTNASLWRDDVSELVLLRKSCIVLKRS